MATSKLVSDGAVSRSPDESQEPSTMRTAQHLPEAACRGERRLQRDVMVVDRAIDDQRRKRRRLAGEEGRLPAGRRSSRVEPRLVAQYAAGHTDDSLVLQLRGQAVEPE